MAITTTFQPLHLALSLLLTLHLLFFFPSEATATGITTHLIPLDSPLSPFYNPSNTHFGRLHDAFQRSLKRVNHFKSTSSPKSRVQAQLIPGGGEFLMNISIGTPPVLVLGIADTGSDLTWTQCSPCKECYSQALPLFDPQHSSTYQNLSCQSSFCNALERAHCAGGQNSTCEYSYSYGDSSYTNGDLATETLTLGINKPVSLPNIVFGCGKNNGGTFDNKGSGLIGLGGGKLSLISQLGQSIGKKFSYCLVPSSNDISRISFGSEALVSGSGAVTTPLVTKNPDTFYYLTLEGFSVGNKRIAYKSSSKTVPDAVDEGNIIIDSGTTLTLVPTEVYEDLVSALDQEISLQKGDDPRGDLSLCYKSESDNIKFPTIIAHFKGGDVTLQPLNMFSRVEDDLVCFTMAPSSDFAIFGNLAQINFLVGYNLEASTVTFMRKDCTKQ